MYSTQIIYKIKLQTRDINMTPSEICDRIFELVDQNHDGELNKELQFFSFIITQTIKAHLTLEWFQNKCNVQSKTDMFVKSSVVTYGILSLPS